MAAKVHAEASGHAAFGFEGSAGLDDISFNDLSEEPTFSSSLTLVDIAAQATMKAECELLAVPVLLAFDSMGLEGAVGPYVSLNATACAVDYLPEGTIDPGFSLFEQHGIAGEFAGRVQLPIIGAGKDFPLISVRALKSDPAYLIGNAQSCTMY
jgi:hypothetical protein